MEHQTGDMEMEDTGKFNWDKEVLFQGETLCADQLDRAKYAEFLTNYLNSTGQRDNGYVINLNAEWGAGKTWFLKRWYRELEENHPVAYIDAWKNDFSDTPMLTVVSGILSSLEADPNTKVLKNRHRFAEKFKTISKRALPTLATGLAKQYLGVDLNDDGKTDSDAAEGVGRMFEKALEAHDQTLKGVEQYRSEITRWLEEATAEKGTSGWKSPMYVFIDELDRCRPTYAIELLETVKHLFEIKGMVFVIATNTDQLQHSIKAVYGTGFDASRYLDRFFNYGAQLPLMDVGSYIRHQPSWKDLWGILSNPNNPRENLHAVEDDLCESISGIATSCGFTLRTISMWLEHLLLIFSQENVTTTHYWLTLVVLSAMRTFDKDLYDELVGTQSLDGDVIASYQKKCEGAFFDRSQSCHSHIKQRLSPEKEPELEENICNDLLSAALPSCPGSLVLIGALRKPIKEGGSFEPLKARDRVKQQFRAKIKNREESWEACIKLVRTSFY